MPAEGVDLNGDPPLLEDLDIDIVKIKYKFFGTIVNNNYIKL